MISLKRDVPATTGAIEPELRFVNCPGASKSDPQAHRMAYWSWGDPTNPRILMCVHGLSRQGRDFDTLAQALSAHYQVICPDVVGRGHSDWLAQPSGYQVFSYVADMMTLAQHLREQVGSASPLNLDWVGTSMGGLIGLGFSTLPPEVSGATEQGAADYLLSISAGFGPHTPEQWLTLSRPLLRPSPDGDGLVLHYDPAMAEPFKAMTAESAASGEAALWQVYDALQCEVLLMRGQNSDLLDADTAQQMTERGPKAKLIEFEGVGHAPTLISSDQVTAVKDFLLA
jgi:pimeloyl-ACP methyl ester carboxylesterase